MKFLTKTLVVWMMVLALFPVRVVAYGTGDGSLEHPYQIVTIQELKDMALDLDAHYILMNDLDLAGVEWTPIGSVNSPFTGSLDGNGFTVSNLALTVIQDMEVLTEGSVDTSNLTTYLLGNIGFFGVIDHAQIFDLNLKEASLELTALTAEQVDLQSVWILNDVKAGILAGSIIGDPSETTLENVHIHSSVVDHGTPADFAGFYSINQPTGILAAVAENLSLKNVSVHQATIRSGSAVGGFVGNAEGHLTVVGSSVSAALYGMYDVGGFFGEVGGSGETESTETVTISESYAVIQIGSEEEPVEDGTGGLISSLRYYDTVILENVFVRGSIRSLNNDDGSNASLLGNTYQVNTLSIHHAYVSVDLLTTEAQVPVALILGTDYGLYDESTWEQTGFATLDFVDLHADSTISPIEHVAIQDDNNNDVFLTPEAPITFHTAAELSNVLHMIETSSFDFESVWVIDQDLNDGYPLLRNAETEPLPDTGEVSALPILLTVGLGLFLISRKPKAVSIAS